MALPTQARCVRSSARRVARSAAIWLAEQFGFDEEADSAMYIAMNRFRIARGFEDGFERVWRERDSYLHEVPGFREFHLLKGETDEECTLYASHSVWASRQAFEDWVNSEHFRRAHAQAKAPKGTYLGHPVFEGFEAVL
jgi:heme-degrading monooxygenase HmoA